MERFYSEVLGLREVTRWDDGVAYRVGAGILLIFDRERLGPADRAPFAPRGDRLGACMSARPRRGNTRPGSSGCRAEGVTIDHEASWPGGARSVYFRDPAGNLLEIADRDLWPE